jgi:predicted DNA-binding transcriptional regulator AlpA
VRGTIVNYQRYRRQELTMATATEDRLLTTGEVAERLRRSDSTVRYWHMTGFLPHGFKIGRRVMYRASDIESWIAERKAAGQSDAAK